MKLQALILLLIFTITTSYSCNNPTKKNTVPNNSQFSIQDDYLTFSDKMENGDTIKAEVNLSSCGWHEKDYITITKTNDKVYLKIIKSLVLQYNYIILPKVEYKPKNDSLSLEAFFNSLDLHKHYELQSPMVALASTSNNEYIGLYSNDVLSGLNEKNDYYTLIMDNIETGYLAKYSECRRFDYIINMEKYFNPKGLIIIE